MNDPTQNDIDAAKALLSTLIDGNLIESDDEQHAVHANAGTVEAIAAVLVKAREEAAAEVERNYAGQIKVRKGHVLCDDGSVRANTDPTCEAFAQGWIRAGIAFANKYGIMSAGTVGESVELLPKWNRENGSIEPLIIDCTGPKPIVRRVLGTFHLTADGCVIGNDYNTPLYREPICGEVEKRWPFLTLQNIDTDYRWYSTESAAKAADAGKAGGA